MNELQAKDNDIINEHKLAQSDAKSAVKHAINCGKMLNEKRATIQHGGWLPWLESVGIPERAAQRYMKAAKNFAIGKNDAASDLTLDSLLGTERKVREKKVKTKRGPEKVGWQAIAIDHKLISGTSGGNRQTIQKKLLAIDSGLIFKDILEGSEEHRRMVAACEALAVSLGAMEKLVEDITPRQLSRREIEIEMQVQDRVRGALQLALDEYNAIAEKQRAVIKAYKGVLSQAEYKQLSGALHSDRYPNLDDVQRGRLDKAFGIVRDKKLELCGDSNGAETSTLPKTVSDLMARRK